MEFSNSFLENMKTCDWKLFGKSKFDSRMGEKLFTFYFILETFTLGFVQKSSILIPNALRSLTM